MSRLAVVALNRTVASLGRLAARAIIARLPAVASAFVSQRSAGPLVSPYRIVQPEEKDS